MPVQGEWDWLYGRQPSNPSMGFPSPAAAPPPSFMSKLTEALGGPQGLMQLGAGLLSASGPSQQRTSFGQALGSGLMANQQFQQQQGENQLKQMLLMSQIKKAQQKEQKPMNVGAGGAIVDPITGKVLFQNPSTPGSTPSAITEYEYFNKLDPEGQKRFLSLQRSPVVPQIALVNGVPTLVDRTGTTPPNPLSTPESEAEAARKRKEAEARGAALGEAAGGREAKAPAQASMDYVLKQFEDQFGKTNQGGPLGIAGRTGMVFDYGDSVRFDNLREQLSTELRTVFRIPGEGTLSDREQAQYGIQLPNRNFPPTVNQAIANDLRERTRLRLQTPANDAASPAPGAVVRKRFNPATGKIE